MDAYSRESSPPFVWAILLHSLENDLTSEPIRCGFLGFLEELTPLHSITSRRHSMWRLIAKHLDGPIQDRIMDCLDAAFSANATLEYKAGYDRSTSTDGTLAPNASPGALLREFRLSEARNPVPKRFQQRPSPSTVCQSGHSTPAPLTFSIQQHMEEWGELLGSLAISLRDNNSAPDYKKQSLVKTLEFCAMLLNILKVRQPGRHRTNDGEFRTWNSTQRRADSFCEFCYRRTMRAIACFVPLPSMNGWSQEQRDRKISRLNDRFCWYHNPSHVKSRDGGAAGMRDEYFQYEKHRIYRKAFSELIDEFTGKQYQPWVLPGIDAHANEQAARKGIYDFLHYSKLVKVQRSDKEQFTLCSTIDQMRNSVGMTQAEIARDLHIPRQVVSRHFKAMDEFLYFRQSRQAVQLKDEAFPPEDDAIMRRSIAMIERLHPH